MNRFFLLSSVKNQIDFSSTQKRDQTARGGGGGGKCNANDTAVHGAVARDVAAARDEAITVRLLCSVSPEIRESWTKPSTRPLTKGNPVYAYLITQPVHLVAGCPTNEKKSLCSPRFLISFTKAIS